MSSSADYSLPQSTGIKTGSSAGYSSLPQTTGVKTGSSADFSSLPQTTGLKTGSSADYSSLPQTTGGKTGAPTIGDHVQTAQNVVADSKSAAAYNAVANHPVTQSIANGPVAENVKEQTAITQNEFSNLSAARQTPSTPAATGQPLTHYHSFFSSLLSWQNPRASGIAFLSIVVFIFGARYLNLLRYLFKLTWMTLGVTVAAEVAGKSMFSTGFTSQFRPKKYYVLPKETLDSMLGDVHELINFFVIESQRIVFAENVFASLAAFLGAFVSYYLIKIVPFWGMALISTSVLFLAPLIYKTNKQLIDHHINNASNVVNQQTEQVKNLASHHASVAAESTKQLAGDYAAKAQGIIGRARSQSPEVAIPKTSATTTGSSTTGRSGVSTTSAYKSSDFPVAPKQPFTASNRAPNEFVTAPTVGSTASTLRDDRDPLIST